ncbi:MAG: glycerol-3-phosphate acyltransferase [Candidatus Cloacimonetes bacterium]|nr:glycerol-3-phosphate acyltransferase [Candidatus Cloacimonadota bacterium]
MISEILFAVGICILSYFLGCFSTARVLAKTYKHLNVYKVGTGLADISNIYHNISKPLGIIAAILDTFIAYIYLRILKYLIISFGFVDISSDLMIFIFGFFIIAGHCLPLTHNFKGGRGIFIYIGLMLIFIPIHLFLILLLAGFLIFFFKQFRFAQYMVVLLPPILCLFLPDITREMVILMAITAFLMGLLNVLVSKRLGEF